MSQTTTPPTIKQTAANFDFDALFGPVARELDFAMDLCGIDIDKVDSTETRAMMEFKGEAELQVYWKTDRTIYDGYVTVANSRKVNTAQQAADAMKADATAQASDDATWQRLLHEATQASQFLVYRAEESRIELGHVRSRYHAFAHCTNCNGRGDVKCCMLGGMTCTRCNGRRRVQSYAGGGAPIWVNCYFCDVTGWLPCPDCGGSKRLDCGGCAATGGHTYAYNGILYGLATSKIRYTGSKYPEEAEAFLARPRAEVIEQSFFFPPTWDETRYPYVGSIGMKVPVQRVQATIPYGDQVHTVPLGFAGRDLRWGPRTPFLDAILEPYIQRIERSAGREAFKVADETTLGGTLIKDIIDKPSDPAGVVHVLHDTISRRTVERITAALNREAQRLTRRPVGRAWIQANVAAIGLWALAAALFGPTIRAALPPSQAGTAYGHLMLAWALLLPALILPAYWWSRRAARRELADVLKQTVVRAPELGGRAAFGSLGLVAIVTLAMIGFAPGRPSGNQVAGQAMERMR